jgi:hypothetical protein
LLYEKKTSNLLTKQANESLLTAEKKKKRKEFGNCDGRAQHRRL